MRLPVPPVAVSFNDEAGSADPHCINVLNFNRIAQYMAEILTIKIILLAHFKEGPNFQTDFRVG